MNTISKMNITAALTMALMLTLGASPAANAQNSPAAASATTTATASATTSSAALAQKSEGEIRKVDKDTQKITIKHGELKNLNMPAMTMVFRVTNPALLDKVKTGDKVSFVAEKINGQLAVSEIEPKN